MGFSVLASDGPRPEDLKSVDSKSEDFKSADFGLADFKIVLKDLRQVYKIRGADGEGRRDFLALENFSLNVKEGEFVSIVGPSGCGKSTLLDIIAGLARADGGQIFIDGQAVTGPALDRGIVMQGYALFPWRTVRRNVEFGLEMKGLGAKDRREVAQKFIELVSLEGFEDRYPYELSGGMKQRVAIARALAYDPKVLLMDEPFAAVDAQTREVLQDELTRILEKTHKTILFVTHSIDEAVILADRVVVMNTNPGSIRTIIDIELERPRTNQSIRLSPAFAQIRQLVWENLQAPAEKAGAGQGASGVDTSEEPAAPAAEEHLGLAFPAVREASASRAEGEFLARQA